MAGPQDSTITVGTLKRNNPDIPTVLQGATILYTTRTDIKASNKFVMIDSNKDIIRNKDGKATRFGFDQYLTFVEKGYLDSNEEVERIIRQDLGMWQMQQQELAAAKDKGDEPVRRYEMTPRKELVKDPSAHLLSFFITCFIITVIVCLGRIFAPTIMSGMQGILN